MTFKAKQNESENKTSTKEGNLSMVNMPENDVERKNVCLTKVYQNHLKKVFFGFGLLSTNTSTLNLALFFLLLVFTFLKIKCFVTR